MSRDTYFIFTRYLTTSEQIHKHTCAASGRRKSRQVWISRDTHRRLLQVKYALYQKDHRIRNTDEVARELIEYWKRR